MPRASGPPSRDRRVPAGRRTTLEFPPHGSDPRTGPHGTSLWTNRHAFVTTRVRPLNLGRGYSRQRGWASAAAALDRLRGLAPARAPAARARRLGPAAYGGRAPDGGSARSARRARRTGHVLPLGDERRKPRRARGGDRPARP